MKNKLLLIIIFFLIFSPIHIIGKNKKGEYLLTSIVFEKPQKEFGYYYQFRPQAIFSSGSEEGEEPYYTPSINLINSVNYFYNKDNYLTQIKIFRKNTTETVDITYDRIFDSYYTVTEYKRVSSPSDLFNDDLSVCYTPFEKDKQDITISAIELSMGVFEKKEDSLGIYSIDKSTRFLKKKH